MTREQEYEAALQERARVEVAERLRMHARFLRATYPDLNKAARHEIMVLARKRCEVQS